MVVLLLVKVWFIYGMVIMVVLSIVVVSLVCVWFGVGFCSVRVSIVLVIV